MTEERALYIASNSTEHDVQEETKTRLRSAGWYVVVTSTDKRKRKQEKGLPDLLAFRYNHTLLIECKRPGGKMRPSQLEFALKLRPHTGPHLIHLIVSDPDQVDRWVK